MSTRAGVASLEALIAFAIVATTSVVLHQTIRSARATLDDAQIRLLAAEEALSTAARMSVDAPWPEGLADAAIDASISDRTSGALGPTFPPPPVAIGAEQQSWRRGAVQFDAQIEAPRSPFAARRLILVARWRSAGRESERRFETFLPPRTTPSRTAPSRTSPSRTAPSRTAP